MTEPAIANYETNPISPDEPEVREAKVILLPPIAMVVALQIGCAPTDITGAEAKRLTIRAASTFMPKQWGAIHAEPVALGQLGTRPETWTFRILTQNPDPNSGSRDGGLLSVNKRTAEVTLPLATINEILGRTGRITGVEAEQTRLRALHCLK